MINLLLVIGLLLVLLVLLGISLNNKLVRLENRRENAFADIDVQLKQRHDLVPQLIGAVKGYMEHEAGTLSAITEARNKAVVA